MANSSAPLGFRPVKYRDGKPYQGAVNPYICPASDSTALYVGDPVILAGSANADGVATITRAAADCCARSATRTTMGLPPRSAKGLSGSRVEAMRAGMMTVKDMGNAYRLVSSAGMIRKRRRAAQRDQPHACRARLQPT